MSNKETEFEVGDICEAFVAKCEVIDVNIDSCSGYTVKIRYINDDKNTHTFTKDGRLINWHKKPSLILIEKAKKEPKYEILYEYICNHGYSRFFSSEGLSPVKRCVKVFFE